MSTMLPYVPNGVAGFRSLTAGYDPTASPYETGLGLPRGSRSGRPVAAWQGASRGRDGAERAILSMHGREADADIQGIRR
jgi:hypothetical protein